MKDFFAKIGRGIGWIIVLIVAFILGAAVAFTPLAYLPGSYQTDFVNMRWGTYILPVFVIGIFTWRCHPLSKKRGRDSRLSFSAAWKWVWAIVSGFALIFWPLGFAVWFNAYDVAEYSIHNMNVVGMRSVSTSRAVTKIETYRLRDPGTGWEADLQVSEARKGFVTLGGCVRVVVRPGRLGFDWIEDAQPCPSSNAPTTAPSP
ncbi:hypothetical protein [Niveispirillum sp. KHB5.9]|uniref:hypothetical protein n=1 Tax=Niveispirillum sp. KHB5.9 TaxID=3400269 RepID=UPI003A83C802